MPIKTSKVATAGTIQRAQAQGLWNVGKRDRPAVWGRISPSRLSAVSMFFHTRGLGSCSARSSPAVQAITRRSETRAAQSGQSFRCARCAGVFPLSFSARLSCSSTQVILLSPSLCCPWVLHNHLVFSFSSVGKISASLCWLHCRFLLSCMYCALGFLRFFSSVHPEKV